MENPYFKVIKYGAVIALLTPLISSFDFIYPFIFPKTIFFRISVEIMLLFYFFLCLSSPKFRPRFNLISVALGSFMLALILSSVFGVNFRLSFWGDLQRGLGVFTWLHLFVYFFILSNVFQEKEHWHQFFNFSVLVGFLIAFYSLCQQFNFEFLPKPPSKDSSGLYLGARKQRTPRVVS